MKHHLPALTLALLAAIATISCSEDLPLDEDYGCAPMGRERSVMMEDEEPESDSESETMIFKVAISDETEVKADTVRIILRR